MSRWIAKPSGDNKVIHVEGPLPFDVDYDDVNPHEVDALLSHVLEVLNTAMWSDRLALVRIYTERKEKEEDA